jgi:hypothetical protein
VFSGTNRFNHNTYNVPDVNARHWAWQGFQNWNGVRHNQQEKNGRINQSAGAR